MFCFTSHLQLLRAEVRFYDPLALQRQHDATCHIDHDADTALNNVFFDCLKRSRPKPKHSIALSFYSI